jgi:hypothetical protein
VLEESEKREREFKKHRTKKSTKVYNNNNIIVIKRSTWDQREFSVVILYELPSSLLFFWGKTEFDLYLRRDRIKKRMQKNGKKIFLSRSILSHEKLRNRREITQHTAQKYRNSLSENSEYSILYT